MAVLLSGFGATPLHGDETVDEAAKAKRDYNQLLSRLYSGKFFPAAPRRVDFPMRESNISDVEVKEIQGLVAEIYPGAILNIGSVVSECRCADGPACSAQVWVVAYGLGRSHGMMLSEIDNEWQIGPVQSWWIEYEDLVDRMRQILQESKTPYRRSMAYRPWAMTAVIDDEKLSKNEFLADYYRLAQEQLLLWERAPNCQTGTKF